MDVGDQRVGAELLALVGPSIHHLHDASLHQWSKGLPAGSNIFADSEAMVWVDEVLQKRSVDQLGMECELGQEAW